VELVVDLSLPPGHVVVNDNLSNASGRKQTLLTVETCAYSLVLISILLELSPGRLLGSTLITCTERMS